MDKQKELARKILNASNVIAKKSRENKANTILVSSSLFKEDFFVYIGKVSKDLTPNKIYKCNFEFGDFIQIENNQGLYVLESISNFISLRDYNLNKLLNDE